MKFSLCALSAMALEDYSFRGEIQQNFPEFGVSDAEIQTRADAWKMPRRATKHSAAYDIPAPYDMVISPGAKTEILLDLMLTTECGGLCDALAMITPRSSLMRKTGLMMTTVAAPVVPNTLIEIELENKLDRPVELKAGDMILQLTVHSADRLGLDEVQWERVPDPADGPAEILNDYACGCGKHFDLQLPEDVIIPANSVKIVPTNVRGKVGEDAVILLFMNPQLAIFNNLELANGVGIVDSDYYANKDNLGNIGFVLFNPGYAPVKLTQGTVLGQSLAVNFFKAENDEEVDVEREGGHGSTNN
jgi:dUTP pyrophosphatase